LKSIDSHLPKQLSCASDSLTEHQRGAGAIGSNKNGLKAASLLVFDNRDDATARRKVCFAHLFVVLRRAFGVAK
jgi:hypothetical protein